VLSAPYFPYFAGLGRTMRRSTVLAPLDERQRYTVDESLEYLRLSRARLYEKLQAGEIIAIKDGRRTFIPGSEIARLSRV
jgi:excisionase family DNA binding protein